MKFQIIIININNMQSPEEFKADNTAAAGQELTNQSPSGQLQLGSLPQLQPPAISVPMGLSLGGFPAPGQPNNAPSAAINVPIGIRLQPESIVSKHESIESTPTFLDSTQSFGNNLNSHPRHSGFGVRGASVASSRPSPAISEQSGSNQFSIVGTAERSAGSLASDAPCFPDSLVKASPLPTMTAPIIDIGTPQLGAPANIDIKGPMQLLPPVAINIPAPVLNLNPTMNTPSSAQGATILSQVIRTSPNTNLNNNGAHFQPIINIQPPAISLQTPSGPMSSLGAPLSSLVNTEAALINIGLAEKESALNLLDLGSSDEDLSSGPSGGCTGEPQQSKKEAHEYRLLNPDTVLRRDSANSTSELSEYNDQVNPMLGQLQKTRSMQPRFDQEQLKFAFNESLPRQFQFSSSSQAERRIEELHADLQKVAKIAKGYREDFLTLQAFIKEHFKSADLLFKNSGFLTGPDGDSQDKMVEVLKSCFQETPCVAMAFASPLCLRVKDPLTQLERVDTMPQLDFAKEFKGAVQGIEATGNAINVQIVPATLEKFTNCLMQKPIGLHFTGHGVENNAAMLGQDTYLMQNQGNCLVFEKDDASAHFVSQQKLKDLFEMQCASLKFVFIATCHSEFAGEIFHWAGVDHVICVKQGHTIIDAAAVFFARNFYQSLFSQKYTICQAFKWAKDCLKMHPEYSIQQEADKLIMILNTDEVKPRPQANAEKSLPGRQSFGLISDPLAVAIRKKPLKKKEHQCCILGPFKKREHELIEQKPTYPFEVAKITEFVGRQREMQEIIACVLQNRLTTVLGVPGIGKTTITKSIGFHLSERKTFADGILFFTLRGKDQTTGLITMLFHFLQKHGPSHAGESGEAAQEPQSMMEKNRLLKQQSTAAAGAIAGGDTANPTNGRVPNFGVGAASMPLGAAKGRGGAIVDEPEYKQDYLGMEQKIHEMLDAKQALIIIDNLEDVLREDEDSLRRFLTELLEKLPGVSILTTSRQKVQNLGEVTECLYELKQLSNSFSIELLEKKCLRAITEDEIRELFDAPAPVHQAYKTPFRSKEATSAKASERRLKIEDHHLCQLLGGHPHAISLVAPFLQNNRRLADLYKMLVSMVASENFMQDMHTLDPTQSLKVSMDTSTLHMRNTQPEALNLFCLLGMLPGGVSEADLPELWQGDQWLVLTESLRRASLIVERVEEASEGGQGGRGKGLRTFRLLPFMNKYAESLLSAFDRSKFHNLCSSWLLARCMRLFTKVRTEESRGSNLDLKEALLQIETNVWASIYRICDFNRDRKATKGFKGQRVGASNHQEELTGYSSAADAYEGVLLKPNKSIMRDNSDVSGDELASNTTFSAANPATQILSSSAGLNKLAASFRTNGTSLPSRPASRKISSEEADSKDQMKARIPDRPETADAPSAQEGQGTVTADLEKDKRRVSFALNTSAIADRRPKPRMGGRSGPHSSASVREQGDTSPFNATLSQIDADSREKSDSVLTVPPHLKSIKVSRLSFMDSVGEVQDGESALGSIDQSANIRDEGDDSSDEGRPQKKLVKSHTQKYLDHNLADAFQNQSDEVKRQASTTDNLKDKHIMLGSEDDHDVSFASERVPGDARARQILTENVDQPTLLDDSTKGREATAFDISFNVQAEAETPQSNVEPQEMNELSFPDIQAISNDESKSLSIEKTPQTPKAKESEIAKQYTGPLGAGAAVRPDGSGEGNRVALAQARLLPLQAGLLRRPQKQLNGSMALRSQLEAIPEKYELSNDSLLIVAYIGVLVLNQQHADAIRAIEIVFASEPSDPLLQANLRKLNALALLKSGASRFQYQATINQAYRQLEEALHIFERIGRKEHCDNEANLGRASCLFGMAHIMRQYPFNFTGDDMDEEACLSHAASLLEQASTIYKARGHVRGAAHCLADLVFTKKKLGQNTLRLQTETKKLRTQIQKPRPATESQGRVPTDFIYRYDGHDISLLVELVDRPQLRAPWQPNAAPPAAGSTAKGRGNKPTGKIMPPSMNTGSSVKKATYSPQSKGGANKKVPRKAMERESFGRKNQKAFASVTRQNNNLHQTTALMQAKGMHMVSQNSTSTEEGHGNPRPIGLAQVKKDNFLSETSDNEIGVAANRKSNPLNKSNQKKPNALQDESLSVVQETPDVLLLRRKRDKRAQEEIDKARLKYQRHKEDKQHSPQPAQYPRPSVKKTRTKAAPPSVQTSAQAQVQLQMDSHLAIPTTPVDAISTQAKGTAPVTPRSSNLSNMKLPGKKQEQGERTSIPPQEAQSTVKDQSPQEIFAMANELELNQELDDCLSTNQRDRIDDMTSQYTSMVSDALNSSFTTNDERTRQPSIQSHATSQHTKMGQKRKKDPYAHVQSKIKPMLNAKKIQVAFEEIKQDWSSSRPGTPARARNSLHEKRLTPARNNESNPFNPAEECKIQATSFLEEHLEQVRNSDTSHMPSLLPMPRTSELSKSSSTAKLHQNQNQPSSGFVSQIPTLKKK